MEFLRWLSPAFLFSQLQKVDNEVTAERSCSGQSDMEHRIRAWKIIGLACLCLLLVNYAKYNVVFTDFVVWFEKLIGVNGEWSRTIRRSEYRELYGYIWWGGINLLGFLVLPMLAIRFWLKEPLQTFGWQWGEVHLHWRGYLLLAAPIMVFAIVASFGADFSGHYPFYSKSYRSWFDLLVWEAIYILQFIAVEFFFRGYLLHGLKRNFGSLSIAVMCLPYLMLHFQKLWPESLGAILFGFFLGVLALMSRSIWGGVMVHVSIALTMDLAAMIQTKGLPENWM